jgi:hypothetical protein
MDRGHDVDADDVDWALHIIKTRRGGRTRSSRTSAWQHRSWEEAPVEDATTAWADGRDLAARQPGPSLGAVDAKPHMGPPQAAG